jgi:hypothetical protein
MLSFHCQPSSYNKILRIFCAGRKEAVKHADGRRQGLVLYDGWRNVSNFGALAAAAAAAVGEGPHWYCSNSSYGAQVPSARVPAVLYLPKSTHVIIQQYINLGW